MDGEDLPGRLWLAGMTFATAVRAHEDSLVDANHSNAARWPGSIWVG